MQDAAGRAAHVPIVSGFTLDIDPLWSLLYDVQEGLIDWPPTDPWRVEIPPELSELDYWVFEGTVSLGWLATRFQGYRRRELFRRVQQWNVLAETYRGRTGKERLPVVMTIVYRPLRPPDPKFADRDDDLESLRSLVSIVREAKAAIRIEERTPARLALFGGDRIDVGPTKFGTFGGILNDVGSATIYGVTCSHVAATGDNVSDVASVHVGNCIADTARVALRTGAVCNPVNLATPNPSPGNGPDLNMLDCSLIKMAVKASTHAIAGISSTLTPRQNVVLHGAVTGVTKHKLGSLCMSYQFNHGGQDFCFRDAIELIPQPWGPFGGAVGHLMTTVPQQGDSGGWVLTDNQPPDWAGLFFGEDGTRGFAIRATWVHEWAENTLSKTLTV